MQKVDVELLRIKGLLEERGEQHGDYNKMGLDYFANGINIKTARVQHGMAKILTGKIELTESEQDSVRDLAGYCILLLAKLQK